MSRFLLIAVSFLAVFGFTPQGQKVELQWKIGKEEKLSYLTVMTDIDTSSVEMNFGGLFKAMADSTGKGLSEAKQMFRKLNESVKNVDLVTTLTNQGAGVVDIVMVANQNKSKPLQLDTADKKQTEIIKMMQSMNQGVMLRGSVFAKGGIHSFWIKSNQKNLVSFFFELPSKPVKIGDSWQLDVNLIANDQNFECDSAQKVNKVTLVDIKQVKGETIAVLKYDIQEFVSGKFSAPSFSTQKGEAIPTRMKLTHQAIAEFSIDKGRWVSYDGLMTLVASGVMTANKKTKFTLQKG